MRAPLKTTKLHHPPSAEAASHKKKKRRGLDETESQEGNKSTSCSSSKATAAEIKRRGSLAFLITDRAQICKKLRQRHKAYRCVFATQKLLNKNFFSITKLLPAITSIRF